MTSKYITVPCAVCGKGKKLRIDNRTCSADCFMKHHKDHQREYQKQYYAKRKSLVSKDKQ